MLWRFNRVYNPARQVADHGRPVRFELPLPRHVEVEDRRQLYIHAKPTPQGRKDAAQNPDAVPE
jgi:magnesium-protoporphyrin IX monomethyl ester (oxidative) cyclase